MCKFQLIENPPVALYGHALQDLSQDFETGCQKMSKIAKRRKGVDSKILQFCKILESTPFLQRGVGMIRHL